jgi:guanylate kinase
VQESVLQTRLTTARQEIQKYHEYRYVLVNDVLERAAEELSAIVIAERCKADRKQPSHPNDPELLRTSTLARDCLLENSDARLHKVLASFGLSM